MQIVWFKRDLRLHDHAPLHYAAQTGPVLPLYILEPELWQQPDLSHRHYQFLLECLSDLNESLSAAGHPLIIKVGRAVDVLKSIVQEIDVKAVWSHQETWNHWTYDRDRAVKRWLKSENISWHEPRQYGVIRCLASRNGWSEAWEDFMAQPVLPPPALGVLTSVKSDPMPTAADLGLLDDNCLYRQQGGRRRGIALLKSFLYERGEGYTKEMSSPLSATDACSRLSPHIAFGTLSMREIYQATERRVDLIKNIPWGERGKWGSAMRSFSARLRWHCHFIQKLEDEPRIEFENMHSAYDGIRDPILDQDRFEAWKTGRTGYPMIDACMRSLIATGWINFRMRAMLMSFSSHHLWLHWREPALHLARLFTDYEPGIHYSQVQMQSGTTGINSIRIYNPIKQSQDQDPEGIFIRQWIPELAMMPQDFIHTPWKAPSLMNGYPMPIVDEKTARTHAADQLYSLRKDDNHRQEAKAVVAKHASRKSPSRRSPLKKSTSKKQLELPF